MTRTSTIVVWPTKEQLAGGVDAWQLLPEDTWQFLGKRVRVTIEVVNG